MLLTDRDTIGKTGLELFAQQVGHVYQHSGNHHFYKVVGVTWLSEMDLWGLKHIQVRANEGVVVIDNDGFCRVTADDFRMPDALDLSNDFTRSHISFNGSSVSGSNSKLRFTHVAGPTP